MQNYFTSEFLAGLCVDTDFSNSTICNLRAGCNNSDFKRLIGNYLFITSIGSEYNYQSSSPYTGEWCNKLRFFKEIDEQCTRPFCTHYDERRKVLIRLETGGKGGSLITGPKHYVQLDTPLGNFWAIVDTIQSTNGMTRIVQKNLI